MRRLVACPACQRPHRADEAACPFCGQARAAVPGRLHEVVRTAKVGGLLAFTAVAAAACYGTPPPPGSYPSPASSATAAPVENVPAKAGTAFRFVTGEGGTTGRKTVALAPAVLEGGELTLSAQDDFYMNLKVPAAAYEVKGGVYRAIDLATAEALELRWGLGLSGKLPAAKIKGTLQLKDVSDKAISGTLLAEVDGVTVKLYFNAAR